MQNFFDPTEHTEVLIPMYGTIHIITLLVLLAFIPIMLWQKEQIKKLAANRRFIVSVTLLFMFVDYFYWAMIWLFHVEPKFERFPLHLCASLALILPVLILLQKDKWIKFFSYWAVCAGFISLANPSFIHDAPRSFVFIHYLVRHYFLFLMPVFLQIGRSYQHRYPTFLKSMFTLAIWAFLIFLLDWATGANYMHLGINNPLQIPFLPKSFTVWPYSYPSFVGVGIILLHISFFSFGISSKRKIIKDEDAIVSYTL